MEIDFAEWVEKQIESAPDDICAFCFNIYEEKLGFSLEVVGSKKYLTDDPDWACREDFVPSPRLRWKPLSGLDWESCLEAVKQNIRQLLDTRRVDKLVEVEVVAVGFVDGDLHVLKS